MKKFKNKFFFREEINASPWIFKIIYNFLLYNFFYKEFENKCNALREKKKISSNFLIAYRIAYVKQKNSAYAFFLNCQKYLKNVLTVNTLYA